MAPNHSSQIFTPPKFNYSLSKMMVGKITFPFGARLIFMYFQGAIHRQSGAEAPAAYPHMPPPGGAIFFWRPQPRSPEKMVV